MVVVLMITGWRMDDGRTDIQNVDKGGGGGGGGGGKIRITLFPNSG